MKDGENETRPLDEVRRRYVGSRKDIVLHGTPGQEFLYRPGVVLVHADDEGLVADRLRERGGRWDEETNAGFRDLGLPVVQYILPDDMDVPGLARELRGTGPDQPTPRIGPHHVLYGTGNYHGGPSDEPRPADEIVITAEEGLGTGVTVGICDTGIAADTPALHPHVLAGHYTEQRDDIDPLDGASPPPNTLDLQAGHGTFIAGVVLQVAPGARFDPEVALDSAGYGDEVMLARALKGLEPEVAIVNLSLGGFSDENLPPVALEALLRTLDPNVVVVAAAGNDGERRPFWPAAFKRVIGVAAVDTRSGTPQPAAFSNFGSWVDACAPGVEVVSTYVRGEWQLDGDPDRWALDGYARWSGTSFAAPFVAGAIAARMSRAGVSARQAAYELLDPTSRVAVPDFGLFVDGP